ncbi:DUF2500 domain-containing protein [Paenibacillus glufosinatiresistens]|uniref:DUF2500 domain-containing protein n=1 Tax=Paenibacillus glufosinatiresistens TaxID=3070657 RepID=UPI00286E3D52|nr:DUF2500 domain-containing protein [Paenibacillus sp. YX.27]
MVIKLVFVLIILFLVFWLGALLYNLVRGLRRWSFNNASPLEEVFCTAVTRRARVTGGAYNRPNHTDYFITFEMGDGQRLELRVPDEEYGGIVEGDRGVLTHKGTRFKGFRRHSAG